MSLITLLALLASLALAERVAAPLQETAAGVEVEPESAPEEPADEGPAARRVDELVRALGEAAPDQLPGLLARGHAELVALSAAGDLPRALPLAVALHERAGAPWSADSLSLTLSRLGQHGRARDVLGPLLARTPPGPERAALLQRRALAALAAGEDQRARVDLGSGLAAGSTDAASVLGLMALRAGEHQRARRLFRTVLEQDRRQAWALRGWGLTMLPSGAPPGDG